MESESGTQSSTKLRKINKGDISKPREGVQELISLKWKTLGVGDCCGKRPDHSCGVPVMTAWLLSSKPAPNL
ncbi:unnamed protein product [Moneuplotes crassus]|uniref:Uncharacterized protein n=1 Tax=Euplotes crassus TaxID=5936 RepID=A0AAD1YAM1_EUPCR|nr:unnamed protein product [Moneuplotes crassus]